MTVYEPEGATGRPGGRDCPDTAGADAGYDAVVLAGGAARRLGGEDKPGVRVGGRTLLDRVLSACADATRTVVVAGSRPTARPVEWAREDPPGGGPLAALDAGLRHTVAPYVLVLSADLPFLGERTVRRLLDTLRTSGPSETPAAPGTTRPAPGAPGTDSEGPGTRDGLHGSRPDGRDARDDGYGPRPDGPGTRFDGVLLVDPEGRDQPLVAVYRADALRRELDVLAAAHGSLAGLPLRRLVAALDLTRITDSVASFDCDTWDDIAAARVRIREHGHVLDEWISAVKDELGIDLDVDTGVLLDLARGAAPRGAGPAPPVTPVHVGYPAARAPRGPGAGGAAPPKAAALALRWAEEETTATAPDAASPGATTTTAPDAASPGATTATEPDAG
ncbi:NTP transferase domain-containing protein [Streptomyces sp. NPDC058751]|uniref:NTP transferase domain-containing protein n=1 Tax=Streptomyces sp. NPDC058751 TaxID=3346623 RepID=UPI0036C04485